MAETRPFGSTISPSDANLTVTLKGYGNVLSKTAYKK